MLSKQERIEEIRQELDSIPTFLPGDFYGDSSFQGYTDARETAELEGELKGLEACLSSGY